MPLHLLPPGGLTSTAMVSHGPLTRVFSGLPAAPLDAGPSMPAQHVDEVLDSSLRAAGGRGGRVVGTGAEMIRGCLDQVRGMVEPRCPAWTWPEGRAGSHWEERGKVKVENMGGAEISQDSAPSFPATLTICLLSHLYCKPGIHIHSLFSQIH